MTHKTTTKRGRGYPPVAHQFQKGQSGNPKGRPPKVDLASEKAVDIGEILGRLKSTRVPVQSEEGVRELPYAEALIHQLANAALRNTRDGFHMLKLLSSLTGDILRPKGDFDEPAAELLDHPIIKRYFERELRKRLQQKGERDAAADLMRQQFGSTKDAADGIEGA